MTPRRLARWVDVRPGEGRATLLATSALLGLTAAHTLLETARDALFLTRIPLSQLPLMYILVALAGVAVSVVRRRSRGPGETPRRVAGAMLAGAFATGVFGVLLVRGLAHGPEWLYALYVFTGVLAGYLAIRLWLLVGARFTIVEAKRLFGVIGAGAVLGAVFGAAIGRALLAVWEPAELVLVAAVILAVTALGPVAMFGPASGAAPLDPRAPAVPSSLAADARALLEHPYTLRLFAVALAAAVAVTAADVLFKTALATRVAADELAPTLATVHLVQNGLALVVQVGVVGWVLRTFGVHRAALALPVLLAGGAALALAGGGLVAAVFLRGTDGALRHSLARTSSELLYVPLPDALRARAKTFIDLIGQRGGQALAASIILALGLVGAAGERVLAGVVLLASGGWIVLVWGLRQHYLDLFRAALRHGRVDAPEALPALDLSALEALITALNSPRDAEVLGALDLLAAQGRVRLIPALVLYHPSRAVVCAALELFAAEGRVDFVPMLDRLLAHDDPTVRAAVVRARAEVAFDEAWIRARLDDDAEVRGTALVCLAERGVADLEPSVVASSPPEVAIAAARAFGPDTDPRLDPLLELLARRSEPEVQLEAAWAMGRGARPSFVGSLCELLGRRIPSSAARAALVSIGAPALEALDRVLGDERTEREVRLAVPRAIADFAPAAAAPILVRHFARITDGALHFRLLRALQRVRTQDPSVAVDAAVLLRAAEVTAARIHTLADDRATFEALLARSDAAVGRLLVAFIVDKARHAEGRMVRILALACPGERADRIQRGLGSADPKVRASSRELLENVLSPAMWRVAAPILEGVSGTPAAGREHEVLARLAARTDALGLLAGQWSRELGAPVGHAPPPESSLWGLVLGSAPP